MSAVIAMPTQAMSEAGRTWKSPIRRMSTPSRPPIVSPAHAPRTAARNRTGQPAAGAAPDEDVEGRVEDADQDREDRRGAHRLRRRSRVAATAERAIRPPPRTTSPSYSTAACPGATAHTGSSVSTTTAPRPARRARGEPSPERGSPGGGSGRRPGTPHRRAAGRRRTSLRSSANGASSRGPRAGRAGSRSRRRRSGRRTAARRARCPGPCAGRR